MQFERSSGILLHPTSLPGRFGIGEIGEAAFQFIDFLAETSQHLWQIMPLGPTGFGDSPYQSFSAFAGNPLLISFDTLIKKNLLTESMLNPIPYFSENMVDYGKVINYKFSVLKQSYEYFTKNSTNAFHAEFEAFCEKNKSWLQDFALFMALKDANEGKSWIQWEKPIAQRNKPALDKWEKNLESQVGSHKYYQFLFYRQWSELKNYANEKGIKIVGDVPIFMAHDSCDVWANPDLFYLDKKGNPLVVAGVPPDYFSETGQLWGNPLYRWDVMKKQNFKWWVDRIRKILETVDVVRLDHFRGFEGYWEVPAKEKTAINGRWVKGPGADLFVAISEELGTLIPIIAEDLGIITPEVEELRDHFGFPGMKVLQFAFSSDSTNKDLPHNFIKNCVVYTGTHDNDTTLGWYTNSSTPNEQDYYRRYCARDGHDVAWDFIRMAMSSVAQLAIIPLQDILALGSSARMNFPSKPSGNWTWRLNWNMLNDGIRYRLNEMTHLFRRA